MMKCCDFYKKTCPKYPPQTTTGYYRECANDKCEIYKKWLNQNVTTKTEENNVIK